MISRCPRLDFYQLSSRSNLQPAEGSVSTWICTSRIVSPSQPTSSKPFCRFWPRKCKLRKPKMRKYQFLLCCSNSYFPTCTSEGKGMLSNFVWCCLACLRNVRKPRRRWQARRFCKLCFFFFFSCPLMRKYVENWDWDENLLCYYWMYEIEKVQHAEKLQSSVIVLGFPNALSALLLAPSSFAFSFQDRAAVELLWAWCLCTVQCRGRRRSLEQPALLPTAQWLTALRPITSANIAPSN